MQQERSTRAGSRVGLLRSGEPALCLEKNLKRVYTFVAFDERCEAAPAGVLRFCGALTGESHLA